MKRLLPLLVLFGVASSASAQALGYGNEWIDYGRQYWKFEVFADGVYRIDSAALAQSGFPIALVDPRHLMLFGKEQQVPIYVQGEGDGEFNAGDFIEFRAEKADGQCDRRLYPYPAAMANPYYSLWNDTVRYFLTWDEQAPAMHIKSYTNNQVDAAQPRPWVWTESLLNYTNDYLVGQIDPWLGSQNIPGTSSMMIEAEGFTGPMVFNTNQPEANIDVSVQTPSAYTAPDAPPARVTTTSIGMGVTGAVGIPDHHLQVKAGPGFAQVMFDTLFNGPTTMRRAFDIPGAWVGAATPLRFSILHDLPLAISTPNYLDWQSVTNVLVRYARTLNAVGAQPLLMEVPDDGSGPLVRLDIGGFAGTPVVYAWGDTVRRVVPEFGTAWHALFPRLAGSPVTKAYAFALESIQPITALRLATPTGYFTDYGQLDADSALLIVAHRKLWNGATAYRNYRENQAPPRRRRASLLVDVDELYDQYGAGVPMNAGAIRMFCKHVLDAWSTAPQGLFLIGKGVNTWNAFFSGNPSVRPDAGGAYALTLVPTYGFPSSDQCFTTGLNFDVRRMDIPVGRISANDDAQVIAYLAKVAATEGHAATPSIWQKNIMHFAGGFTPGEITTHGQILDGLGQIAAGPHFGANMSSFRKNTSEVISTIGLAAADSVRRKIEDEGVTMMTFLSHAYSSSFDVTIDEPQNYNWGGKHPLLVGNSCYIGNVHLNGPFSTTENWTLMPNAGPHSFLASTQQGFRPFLVTFTNNFYESLSRINHGASIGEHMKYAGMQSQVQSFTLPMTWHVHTFHLEGDPTLVLNTHDKPDYSVSAAEILFEPAIISADVDSFTVKVVVSNLGRAIDGSINVELQRINPGLGAQPITYFTTLDSLYLRDTAMFRLPTLGFAGGQGSNTIRALVDLAPDLVAEMDDIFNNTTSTTLFITSGDIVPVYPYDFAVVPDPTATLMASTGDPLAPVRTYVFQIDTTDTFDSPAMESATLQAPGGVVSWDPPGIFALNALQDSTVFFWRCSIDSAASGNGQYNWYERSFQYIPQKRGWGQAHIFQFKKDYFSGIRLDRDAREFLFDESERNVRAAVAGNISGPGTNWAIDLSAQDYGGCGPAAWHVAVIDPVTFEAWATRWTNPQGQVVNPNNNFGNGNDNGACRNRTEKYFSFSTNSAAQLAGLQNMLVNAIPTGHHILVYSWRHLDKQGTLANGGAGVMQALEGMGAGPFAQLQDSVPYICYLRKGFPDTFRDTVGISITDSVNLSVWVPTAFAQGVITTVDVGPAFDWQALYWDEQPSDVFDTTRIKLQGLALGSGNPVELIDVPSELDEVVPLAVSAAEYPVLRVQGRFSDANISDAKPAQLKRWHLLSSPVPECAIHPPLGYYNGLEGWSEGQMAKVAVAVQNISEFDMDSLLIAAWIIRSDNSKAGIHYRLNAPLPAGAWVVDTVRFSTIGFGGWNTLVIEANPLDSLTGRYHQLEQYHFNNIAQWRFKVEEDRENPILDVTFDGRHILNGDIVSARPEVQVTLDDENVVRLLSSPGDTAAFKVFLRRPGAASLERLWFRDGEGNEQLQFVPASSAQNIARIYYRPNFAADGEYCLNVQASDLSFNIAGDNEYKVCFEVVNKPTITEVLNYPNPFTTSTRFVFTLTGSEVPSQMRIQILTVTGKVVRDITAAELGPLRIGRNITEFAWDGTDQFGDRLARGVYLYRVQARLNGSDMEVRESGASPYFTKGFGKMYLMR
jgi:hypothetical protein